jgi:hypothetical protein
MACALAPSTLAQESGETKAITARVHGTFSDSAGGLGVLSGDLRVIRFEIRNGTLMAVGEIVGSLADSAANVLGLVKSSRPSAKSGNAEVPLALRAVARRRAYRGTASFFLSVTGSWRNCSAISEMRAVIAGPCRSPNFSRKRSMGTTALAIAR